MMAMDEWMLSAVGRLAESEKDCLRRWLLPQSAKEMAIDLGVSPHAIEKRLKMARAKLGVSSSRAAARLLVAAEGDQGPVPQSSALPPVGRMSERTEYRTLAERTPRLLIGAVTMMTAAILLVTPGTQASIPPHTDERPTATAATMRKVDLDEAAAFDREDFAQKDKDHSGFLDPREAGAIEPRDAFRDSSLPSAPLATERDLAGERKWMAKLDRDRDGQVSEEEYVDYMVPWTLWHGVPKDWVPRRR